RGTRAQSARRDRASVQVVDLKESSMSIRVITLSVVAALVAGCGSGNSDSDKGGGVAHDEKAAVEGIKRPAIQTQAYLNPCGGVPRERVAQVPAPPGGEPQLGRSAESPRPDNEGLACVYPFTGRNGKASRLAIQVDPSGSAEFEQAMG